jgi:hypothetical protein
MITHGGLKKKNSEKIGFQPVYDMIMAQGTTFKVLTVDSLKGYLIIMFVEGENYEYFTHNDRFTRIDVPVRQYILKFAITDDDDEHGLDPFVFNGDSHGKESDRQQDFFLEAKLQSTLWWHSVSSGRFPVCPSVANISFFSDDAANLLDVIASKPYGGTSRESQKLQSVRDYLVEQLGKRKNRSVGMITQNLLQSGSTPARKIADVLDDKTISEPDKRNLVIFAAAQVLRLYLNYRVIHCDLHLGNILVAGNACYIIDFGRVFNFLSEDYYSPAKGIYPPMHQAPRTLVKGPVIDAMDPSREVPGLRETALAEINDRKFDRKSDADINSYIRRIFFQNLIPIDNRYIQFFFDVNSYQMEGLMREINKYDTNGRIFFEIYRKYVMLNTGSGTLNDETIKKYEKIGFVEKPNQLTSGYFNTPFPAGALVSQLNVKIGDVTKLISKENKMLLCFVGMCFVVKVLFKGGKNKRNKNCKTRKRY